MKKYSLTNDAYDSLASMEGGLIGRLPPKSELQPGRVLPSADMELLRSPEVWPDPVDAAGVLDAVARRFGSYLALDAASIDGATLWTAHTHAFAAFSHTPRLNLTSPEKGCGKTTAVRIIASLTPRPLRTESVTAPVLFRMVESFGPTLLLDELDTYLAKHDELRGLLNAGHERGAKVYRCEGPHNEVRGFSSFAPAALAGIGALPSTLHDRSIVVRLLRAMPGEIALRWDSRNTAVETQLCRKLARLAADNFARLENCDPKLPQAAHNRLADNWRPLFAFAEVAGGDWPERAARAFARLVRPDKLEGDSIGTQLLADINRIFHEKGVDKVPSAELAAALAACEGRPWPEFGPGQKPVSPHQMATLLSKYGIMPQKWRNGGRTERGYLRADFGLAFQRFLQGRDQ
jgi:hypothetical protein